MAQVDTLALRHDKFDSSRERIGSLFLVADERHVQLEHAKHIDQLYNDEQWQRIFKEEQEARLRFRRQELRQDESIDKAELTLQNAERLQAVRAREIDLYSRIVEARNRKDALERGAGDMVSQLEHELAKKGAAREDASMEWSHLRELAGIRMRTELEIAQQGALEARQLAQQRFSHQLLQQQIENKIAQALGIEDETRKRAELVQLHARRQAEARREMEIEEEQHKAAWQSLALVNAAHKREAERIAEWEDQLALDKKRELMRSGSLKDEEATQKLEAMRRSGAQADAITQYEKLLRTIEADGVQSRQAQEIELDAEQARHTLKQQERETEWQQELRRLDHAREEKYAHLAHEADLARIDIARNESIGAMSDTAKLALAAAPNAAALADFMKTQLHSGMSADQLSALSGVVSATNSVTPAEAARAARALVEGEQARRDLEVDKDRRHQLDLLGMQNDVNKTALASQSELGKGIVLAGYDHAPRTCPNGHRVEINDKFCAECGAALHP